MAALSAKFPTPEETNASMRAADGDIRETIAQSREIIRQSRELLARANRLIGGTANTRDPKMP